MKRCALVSVTDNKAFSNSFPFCDQGTSTIASGNNFTAGACP